MIRPSKEIMSKAWFKESTRRDNTKPLSLFQCCSCCPEDGLPAFHPHLEDLSWHARHIVSGFNKFWAQAAPWPTCIHLFQVGEIPHEPCPLVSFPFPACDSLQCHCVDYGPKELLKQTGTT